MFDLPDRARGDDPPPPQALHAFSAGWRLIVARDHRPIGVRLALQPVHGASAGAAAIALPDILDSVIAGFQGEGGAPFPRGLVVLAPLGFELDGGLAQWTPPRNVLLEVGVKELGTDGTLARVADVRRNGVRLVLRIDDVLGLDRKALASFQYIFAEAPLSGAEFAGSGWLAGSSQAGAKTRAQVQAAFDVGAHAIIGWPIDEPVPDAPGALQPSQKAVLELIRLLQAEAETADLERAFKGEPVLAYLLLTLANSAAFRRSTPIGSLGQAITLLGYKRLLKWLVLLLVIASKGSHVLPQIYTAVARGFTMENVTAASGAHTVQDDCFVTGAFSLLDRITGVPLDQLFGSISLPPAIADAVCAASGPLAPYLAFARSLEDGTVGEAVAAATAIGAKQETVNAALLQALAATDALQSLV